MFYLLLGLAALLGPGLAAIHGSTRTSSNPAARVRAYVALAITAVLGPAIVELAFLLSPTDKDSSCPAHHGYYAVLHLSLFALVIVLAIVAGNLAGRAARPLRDRGWVFGLTAIGYLAVFVSFAITVHYIFCGYNNLS